MGLEVLGYLNPTNNVGKKLLELRRLAALVVLDLAAECPKPATTYKVLGCGSGHAT